MSKVTQKPTSSLEDYLEAISVLKEECGRATVTALSKALGVKKPSVDWALKKLAKAGLVIHEKYGDVDLTPEGARIADEVHRRHKMLLSFLTKILKVDPETADQDACNMEHALSEESIKRLEVFIDFAMGCHPGKQDWEETFNRHMADYEQRL